MKWPTFFRVDFPERFLTGGVRLAFSWAVSGDQPAKHKMTRRQEFYGEYEADMILIGTCFANPDTRHVYIYIYIHNMSYCIYIHMTVQNANEQNGTSVSFFAGFQSFHTNTQNSWHFFMLFIASTKSGDENGGQCFWHRNLTAKIELLMRIYPLVN